MRLIEKRNRANLELLNSTITMPISLQVIINSIENDKCILILGPELYYKEANGKIVDRQLFIANIEESFKSSIYLRTMNCFLLQMLTRRRYC